MRVLFLCEGTTVPASRFRVGQFIPHLEEAGVECEVRYAYDWRYNDLSRTRFGPAYKALWRLKRVPFAADADEFDIIFVQRPAIPQSSLPERLLASINPNIVFDFDDSIFLAPGGVVSDRRERAMHDIIALSRRVIAGNRYLAHVALAPEKTTVIPTVIDTERYVPPAEREDSGELVIGWMGTEGNFPFLEQVVEPVNRALDRLPNAKVRIVSNADFAPWLGDDRVEQIRWSVANELPLLQSFDIGLMPLEEGPLTRGKCSFKMIQYMAVGCPVVVSAVGANVEVFEGSRSGHCVLSFDEFEDAIVALGTSREARDAAGRAGRAHVERSYSIAAVLPRYLEVFEKMLERARDRSLETGSQRVVVV